MKNPIRGPPARSSLGSRLFAKFVCIVGAVRTCGGENGQRRWGTNFAPARTVACGSAGVDRGTSALQLGVGIGLLGVAVCVLSGIMI